MTSTNNTKCYTLITLPLELKHKIIRMLLKDEITQLRLVSTEFCHDINLFRNKPIIGTLTNASYELVKNSTFDSFAKLKVENFTNDLKLFSSTRCEIPYSKHVVLKPGNSEENTYKLLRHYCKYTTKKLTLHGPCFSNLSIESMKNTYLSDLNIKSLMIEEATSPPPPRRERIKMTYQETMQHIINLENHRLVMKYFLDNTFSKLETLKLSPSFTNQFYKWTSYYRNTSLTNIVRRKNKEMLCKQIQKTWNRDVLCFLSRNGNNIKKFGLEVNSKNMVILKHMDLLVNLECLDLNILYFERLKRLATYLKIGLGQFTNLKHFNFECYGFNTNERSEFHITTAQLQAMFLNLLKLNGSTLESICLKLRLIFFSQAWFITYACPKLTSLTLDLGRMYCHDTTLDYNYKLNSLQLLKISLGYTRQCEDKSLAKWILQVAPYLKELELGLFGRDKTVSLADTKTLLLGLEDSLAKATFIYKYRHTDQNFSMRNNAVQQYCDDSATKYVGSVISIVDAPPPVYLEGLRHKFVTYQIQCF